MSASDASPDDDEADPVLEVPAYVMKLTHSVMESTTFGRREPLVTGAAVA